MVVATSVATIITVVAAAVASAVACTITVLLFIVVIRIPEGNTLALCCKLEGCGFDYL
jgi:hypothetical protein